MNYNQLQQQGEIPIYNPKDLNKNPYFKFKNGPFINPECKLTEKEYEKLCEIKGINPIYPPKGKRIVSVEQRIADRRKELGIKLGNNGQENI